MKTIKSEFIGTDATGKDFYRVIIVSESAPDSFPTSGADVDGVPDTAGIAAGSVLLTPDGNSVLYTDGWSEGGADVLKVTITNGTGDATWQQISDAFNAGTTVTVTWEDEDLIDGIVTNVTQYEVQVNDGAFVFFADSADGYINAD